MTESKRSDKKTNIDKVTAWLVKNPLASERDLAKMAWISPSTAHIAKKEIEQSQAKDGRIISLTNGDFKLMQRIQKEKNRRMDDEKDQISNMDINNWDKVAQARYTVFTWDVTDQNWGMKVEVSALDTLNNLIK